MTTFLQDFFTDTDGTALSAHTPNVGGAWSLLLGTDPTIQSGQLTQALFVQGRSANAATPPSADYVVSADVVVLAVGGGAEAGVTARVAGGGADGYLAKIHDSDQTVKLFVISGFGLTLLDSQPITGYAAGATFALALSVAGTTIEVSVNGSTLSSVTDTAHSAPGAAGVYMVNGSNAGLALDNLSAGDGGAGPGVHTLTGRGSTAIASPAWLQTDVSGVPGNFSMGSAEPPNFFHIGLLSWGTAHGAMAAYPVTREHDLVELPAGMDTLWWSLAPGVTFTVTERSAP